MTIPLRAPVPRPAPVTNERKKPCPDCGGPLARQSACVYCIRCGWARCD